MSKPSWAGMDPRKLPKTALVDSSVFIRAVDPSMDDDATPDCRDFWTAMLREARKVLIAAPTVAEFLRRPREVKELPRVLEVEYVAFDYHAAVTLGQTFPMKVLSQHRDDTGVEIGYFKYDALIAACALQWEAECVVSLDQRFRKLCQEVGLNAKEPSEFRTSQLPLNLDPDEEDDDD